MMRDRLAEDAGYALWLVIVVREACGLNSTHIMQTYRVPNEAYACTGPSVMCVARTVATRATITEITSITTITSRALSQSAFR